VSAPAVHTEQRVVSAGRTLAVHRHRLALAGVLGIAGALDFLRIDRNGHANTYYAGAVRSMLSSWHLFLWTSFDRGGLVSVDKPPLALWVEALSAKLFGYSGPAILLPEGLAGIGAVWVLYLLVARPFGRVAGLCAALALAVTPVSVAIDRDNNPDALFVFLLVCAAWAGARAVERSRLRWLLASAAFVGLAFETKLLVAAFVVPGLALAYLLCARLRLATRIAHLLAAGAVLLAVSGAWIAAVELTPASDRPWLGSTSDNSALSLLFGYNGFGRVDGQTGGTSSNGASGGTFSGTPGPFRLLNDALGDQIAWLLPLAIVGGCAAAIWAWRRQRSQVGPLLVVGGWFITAATILSISAGIVHTYYVSALAPAVAGLAGIGVVALYRDARRAGPWVGLPLLAVVFTAWLQVALLDRSDYRPWLAQIVVAAAVVACLSLVALAVFPDWRRRGAVAVVALGVAFGGFLAAPAAWSQSTLLTAVDGVFPGAGPNFLDNGFGGRFANAFGGGSGDLTTALSYVERHRAGRRFALIVQSEEGAADSVVAGERVAAMGGFTGRETVLAPAYLARLVAAGEARYFLLGGNMGGGFGGGAGTSNATVSKVESVCAAVASSAWGGGSGTLYDCAGKAALLRE
jgi:4-amino-4-deoxy-L-arabinose transferase-like glycosyltransferase